MLKNLKEFSVGVLNEDVNANLINAKKQVNDQLQAIRNEIQNERDQKDSSAKIASIKKQAALYTALGPMLIALATSMDAKEKSGDKTNVY
jgi:hypothetical protein